MPSRKDTSHIENDCSLLLTWPYVPAHAVFHLLPQTQIDLFKVTNPHTERRPKDFHRPVHKRPIRASSRVREGSVSTQQFQNKEQSLMQEAHLMDFPKFRPTDSYYTGPVVYSDAPNISVDTALVYRCLETK